MDLVVLFLQTFFFPLPQKKILSNIENTVIASILDTISLQAELMPSLKIHACCKRFYHFCLLLGGKALPTSVCDGRAHHVFAVSRAHPYSCKANMQKELGTDRCM